MKKFGGLRGCRGKRAFIACGFASIAWSADASTVFTYDPLGRLQTALYDNGLCIAYSYDANGNRTAISTVATTPDPPTWGTGHWGCFNWTPH